MMESLAPNLFVTDIQQSIAFYRQLGFEVAVTVPESGPYNWAMMTCGQVTIMLQTFPSLGEDLPQISREPGASLLLYIRVKEIRSLFDRIKDSVTVLHGLQQTFYGATEFSIADNSGYVLTFAEDE